MVSRLPKRRTERRTERRAEGVGTQAERGFQVPCDTMRPDDGWFAEFGSGEGGYATRETGETIQAQGCRRYTVWCCR
jgi:hypothetical protein